MHTASYGFSKKPEESAGCHQTLACGWGLSARLLHDWFAYGFFKVMYLIDYKIVPLYGYLCPTLN